MSRYPLVRARFDTRFPRVSGDEPLAAKYSRSSGVFSPRERG